MEAADLFHDRDRGLVIYLQHGSALLPHSILHHLRNKHLVKGEILHAVKDYLQNINALLASLATF